LFGSRPSDAFREYLDQTGIEHPGVELGWGELTPGGEYRWLRYRPTYNCANAMLTLPVNFTSVSCNPQLRQYGSFRLLNAAQFHRYLNGRFYDPVFYAPADHVVTEAIGAGFDVPDQYWRFADLSSEVGEVPAWSSYCTSPAAMFDPAVLAHDDPDDDDFNGWVDPWDLRDGFRSPSYFQATYPSLKTHILEHHWLQEPPGECNPLSEEGTYGQAGCEPYYFNHGYASRPNTLFFDGHVAALPVIDAVAADRQVREQMGPQWGLWSQDTPFGVDGYRGEQSYDGVRSSFHVLTTDGILGRDVTAASADSWMLPPPDTHRSVPRPSTRTPHGARAFPRVSPLE
jgi:prepilin-type processing-associated H-X9-DG protein